MKWVEIAGNMHLHTTHSDGHKSHDEVAAAAIAAGLDFIIYTDHNVWLDNRERVVEIGGKRLLALIGEEVHDESRRPEVNHFLAYGVDKELAELAAEPQALIDATRQAGGYGFLAHPYELPLPVFAESDYSWYQWDLEGFTGLEIWNYMSSFKCAVARAHQNGTFKSGLPAKLVAARMVFNPEKYVMGPEQAALDKWDELLGQGKRVVAVGNSDAHATPMSLGPISRIVFPYEHCFRAVNTHLLIPEPLNGDLEHDKSLALNAIGNGNSWVGYDAAHPTNGFRFSGKGATAGIMGQEIEMDVGATLQAIAPALCRMRLIRHGEVVAETKKDTNLTYIPVEEGAYRVECYREYAGKERGWIFSNPIYII